jgi:hypothetical protein
MIQNRGVVDLNQALRMFPMYGANPCTPCLRPGLPLSYRLLKRPYSRLHVGPRLLEEPMVEIEGQDPGEMGSEGCEEKYEWQQAKDRKEDDVMDQYSSSSKSLNLAHDTGNPVA